jgi:hypothetical protein
VARTSIGKWLLPQPRVAIKENKWIPVPRNPSGSSARQTPFGYKLSEEDPCLYEPIPEQLAALEKAKKHLKNYTSRKVAAWLSKVTGRYISHKGLLQRLRYEQYNRQKVATLRSWARRYKKAILLAEKYEQKVGATKKKSVLEEIGAGDWGARDRTFVNVSTDLDGVRRVYKLCGCKCEHCGSVGTERNIQTEPGTTDSILSS